MIRGILLAGMVLLGTSAGVQAQQDLSQVDIVTEKLADNLYYLKGSGGHIVASAGVDGLLLVDTQFAPLTDRIIAALRELTAQPIRYVVNTHHHGDHIGGNANFARAGGTVLSHENLRATLAAAARTPEQVAGLPALTYTDAVEFHIIGETVHAFHVPSAHTNGDSFVHFRNANVIHGGDIFRTNGYPIADANAGGSFLGIVAAYELLLEISNADTVFVPGHGELSRQPDVQAQLDMFYSIRDRVKAGIDQGLSLEAIQNSRPTAEYDAAWSGGRVQGPDLVAVVYGELVALGQ